MKFTLPQINFIIILGSLSKPNLNDGMTVVTNSSNIKFIYNSPIITFQAKHDVMNNQSNAVEINSKYYLVGGSVVGIKNQMQLRIKLSVLLSNINGLLRFTIGDMKIKQFLSTQKVQLTVLINKLKFGMDYKSLMTETTNLKRELHQLWDLLDGLITKGKVDQSINRMVITRATFILRLIRQTDITPLPVLTKMEEKEIGLQFGFHGTICLYKLCIQHCLLNVSFSKQDPTKVLINCHTQKDQFIRPKIKLEKNKDVVITMSTQTNHFEVKFPTVVSMFHQNVPGIFYFNESKASCYVPNFDLGDGIFSNITALTDLDTTSTWLSLVFKLSGQSDVSSHFVQQFQLEINSFLKQNADATKNKLKVLSTRLLEANQKLKIAESLLLKSSNTLKRYQYEQKVAKFLYISSLVNLNRSRIQFRSYQVTHYLRNYKLIFDSICKLKVCRQQCIMTEACRICQESQTVKTDVLKCSNVKKKVRLTQEEEYDDACHETRKFYETIYTGTCVGGGDSSGIKSALPNWAAGIGHTIGGPVGALIGGLTGAVVGQFFQGCEDTWEKFINKKIVTVPCKKIRLKSVVQEWSESSCMEYEKNIMTKFQSPKECNCSNECVTTQDPNCLHENENCRGRHKTALTKLLQSAGVFKRSATEFLECEKNVTIYQTQLSKATEILKNHVGQHERVQVSLNQIVVLKKKLEVDIGRLNQSSNIDRCLLDKYENKDLIAVNVINFGPVINLETDIDFSVDATVNGKHRLVHMSVNILDVRLHLKQSIKNILAEVFCEQYTRINHPQALPENPYRLQVEAPLGLVTYSKADGICNTILGLYKFLEYPIDSLRTLAQSRERKVRDLRKSLQSVELELSKLKQNKNQNKITQLEVKALKNKVEVLKSKIEENGVSATLTSWRHDMEVFNREANFINNYGFQDTVATVFERFKGLAGLSGIEEKRFFVGLENLRSSFHLILQENISLRTSKDLDQFSFYFRYTFLQLWRQTKYCAQVLPVHLESPSLMVSLIGDVVNLECKVMTTKNVKYFWYVNQKEIPWEHSKNLSIVVGSLSEGSYRCKVETLTKMNVSNDIYMKVEARPVVVQQPADVDIISSNNKSNYSFMCNFTGNPAVQITWEYTPFTRASTKVLSSKDEILTIQHSDVQPGFYVCKGSNKHGISVSRHARMSVLKTCVAHQAFVLSLSIPRKEMTDMLNRIFYSKSASKAWSTSLTQKISIAVSHQTNIIAKVAFRLIDYVVEDKNRCLLDDRNMLTLVSRAKANMVQLLKNVLVTLSVKVDESATLAELRENLRSTLLLEPDVPGFCPRGYRLHESQYKCVECKPGTYEAHGKCIPCWKGSYQSSSGALQCYLCPNGQTTEERSSVSLMACK
ncbi:uncharacterized protein LOC130646079 [Hydractinia symbiolongicarpus]|uniref:uncharacterized protein LOC130646079 n=1 Tax=Hydractinia symbiolongicarpus TaxID=13093 RepID=UPI00255191C3|nr:uncharacterized protein LOC130646079 [Hydractinia symbiolongicarpus]